MAGSLAISHQSSKIQIAEEPELQLGMPSFPVQIENVIKSLQQSLTPLYLENADVLLCSERDSGC
jgi:hypothetical protein